VPLQELQRGIVAVHAGLVRLALFRLSCRTGRFGLLPCIGCGAARRLSALMLCLGGCRKPRGRVASLSAARASFSVVRDSCATISSSAIPPLWGCLGLAWGFLDWPVWPAFFQYHRRFGAAGLTRLFLKHSFSFRFSGGQPVAAAQWRLPDQRALLADHQSGKPAVAGPA
jgi:hypothetical protein